VTQSFFIAVLFAVVCLCATLAESAGEVDVKSPGFEKLIAKDAKVEKLAGGFKFTEGPVWLRDGRLAFSDIPNDMVLVYDPKTNKVSDFRRPSAQTNGNTIDSDGHLVSCEHAGRRVVHIDQNGIVKTLVDSYDGKKLNSPNDVVLDAKGDMFFTDPPYGLPKQDDDPAKELPFNGVYRYVAETGKVTVLVKDLTRPNGLAFSPDGKTLYVANSDPAKKLWMAYSVNPDGTLGAGKVLADVTSNTEDGLPDGLRVDTKGNVWATGPGGIWVFSPEGKHLGTVRPAEVPANCAFGDADGKTLYMTARTGLYRIRTKVEGLRPR
jgi:gluconolactonase